jgi:ubiquinone biosynthesis protein UbiJ
LTQLQAEIDPFVSYLLAALTHAGDLATGGQDAPTEVPTDDLKTALVFAQAVEQAAHQLYLDFDSLLVGGIGATVARIAIGAASSSSRSVRESIERLSHGAGAAVPAFDRHTFLYYANQVYAAQNLLEVVSRERAWSDSVGAQINAALIDGWYSQAEMIVSLVPVFGQLYNLGMAAYGKTLLGRQRSALERVLLVGSTLLDVATLKGAKVTSRALLAAKISNYGQVEVKGFASVGDALAMAVGARELASHELADLSRIGALVRSGATLTAGDVVLANRLVARMREAGTVAEWLSIVEELTGQLEQKGKYITQLKQVQLGPGEADAGQATAAALGEQVVALPKTTPDLYRNGIVSTTTGAFQTIDGVKNPDLLIGRELADIVVPETPNMNSLIGSIGAKGRQGGTVVINLAARSPIRAPELVSALPRFWGRPEFLTISRLVIQDTGPAQVFLRPFKYQVVPGGSPLASLVQLMQNYADAQN